MDRLHGLADSFNRGVDDFSRAIPQFWPIGLLSALVLIAVFIFYARPTTPQKKPPDRSASRPKQQPPARRPESAPAPAPRPPSSSSPAASSPAENKASPASPPPSTGYPFGLLDDSPPVVTSSPGNGPSIIRGARLGGGGLGDVYRARIDGAEVALKVMKADEDDDRKQNETRLRLFKREVDLLADLDGRGTLPRLHHRKIYRDRHSGTLSFVMELIEGDTLRKQVNGGKLLSRPEEITLLVSATASAVAELHERHIIHRDLNPANIILSPTGPRLIDLGIGKRLTPKRTATHAIYGTPAYLAPEMALAEPATPETDVFGWGLTIANALTGRQIYNDADDRNIQVDAALAKFDPGFFEALNGVAVQSPWHLCLVSIIKGCLSANPQDRPKDGWDLQVAAKALQKVLPSTTGSSPQSSNKGLDRALALHMMRYMSETIMKRSNGDNIEGFVAESLHRLLRLPLASMRLQRGIAAAVLYGVFVEALLPAGLQHNGRYRSPVYWEDSLRGQGLDVERTRDGLLVFFKPEMPEAR